VATEISTDQTIDEWITVGTAHTAILRDGSIEVSHRAQDEPDTGWRRAVAHRSRHAANASAVVDALSPTGHPARTELVEHNAALIVRASHDGQITDADALARVREARRSGRAQRLLERLQHRQDRLPPCTAS
jgi:anthranilate phosphoribosyltransferase